MIKITTFIYGIAIPLTRMIDDQETVKDIKSLGLNTYEVKIWTALLSRGVSTAGELSDIANVPRSRSYDVLESLEKKGFVIMKLGKPIKYSAVSPKDVLDKVKGQIEKEKDKRIAKINGQAFTTLIDSLQDVHDSAESDSNSVAAVVKGKKNIEKHLEFLFTHAKKSILVTSPISPNKYMKQLDAAKQKSIQIREIKNTGKNLRVCIIDDKSTLIFPLDVDAVHPDYDLGIWVQNEETTKFLKNLLLSA